MQSRFGRNSLYDEKVFELFHYLKEDNLVLDPSLLASARQRNGKSLRQIGEIYFSRGDCKSLRKAFQWYKVASDYNNSEAHYLLGLCYMNAWGIPKADHQLACYMFSLAGICNHPDSLYKIGFIFHYGLGRPQDYSKAKILYDKAIKYNVARAEYNLGVIYEFGLGVQEDVSNATEHYKKSAENGFLLAQLCLDSIQDKNGFIGCLKPTKKLTQDLDILNTLENATRNKNDNTQASEIVDALRDIGYHFNKSKPLLDIDLVIMVLELANRNKGLVNLKRKKSKRDI